MIKVILVDLGGVYFTKGTSIGMQKICELTNRPKDIINEIFNSSPRKEGFWYRKGQLTEKEFWRTAVRRLGVGEDLIPTLKEAWHSSYEPIEGMKDLISKLRKRFKVVACSGNIKERIDYLDEKYHLKNDFDDFILSYEIGVHKYEPNFYDVVLERIGVQPEECLCVDDDPEFIDSAQRHGMKAILFQNLAQLESDLKKNGIII
ncbi:MAG: HAD family phosphatase [Minisyncoccia bacterium]|jgi:HAD superfamily hydrolase (TIGR01509 family)